MRESVKYNYIDHLRCVLIIMVVLVHTVHFGDQYPVVKDHINFFFMPAFLLLTGYLVNIRKNAMQFAKYIAQIAVPYTIMVVAFALLSLVLPVRDGMQEFSIRELLRIVFVDSIGPYWFLHTMMVCGILYYLACRIGCKAGLDGVRMLCIFASLLLVVCIFTPLLAIRFAAFYFLGAAIRTMGSSISSLLPATLWALLPFAIIITTTENKDGIEVFALVCTFTMFVPALIGKLNVRMRDVIGYIGRNTFPIYLFHPVFTMMAKYIHPLFSFDSTGVLHVSVVVLLSIAGGIGIAKIMDITRASYLFCKPQMLR